MLNILSTECGFLLRSLEILKKTRWEYSIFTRSWRRAFNTTLCTRQSPSTVSEGLLRWLSEPVGSVNQSLLHSQAGGYRKLSHNETKRLSNLDDLNLRKEFNTMLSKPEKFNALSVAHIIWKVKLKLFHHSLDTTLLHVIESCPVCLKRGSDVFTKQYEALVFLQQLADKFLASQSEQDLRLLEGDLNILYTNYVWMYYHLNNLEKVVESFSMIKTEKDEQTIAYFLNSFIVNFEFETFKKAFQNLVIESDANLSADLFHFIVTRLSENKCLFEIIFHCYQVWTNSPKCETPKPELVCIILRKFYQYGTFNEINSFRRSIRKKYAGNNLIQSIIHQHEIINREYLSFKKNLTEKDYDIIESLVPENAEERKQVGLSWASFMAHYSNLDNLNYIIRVFKNDDDKGLAPDLLEVLLKYHQNTDRFVPLLHLIENVSKTIPFKEDYLATITSSFAYCYSRFLPAFVDRLNSWLGNSNAFQIHRTLSPFFPFHLKQELNPLQYRGWSQFVYFPDLSPEQEQKIQSEVRFRIDRGIPALLDQGVQPDFKLILDVFRVADLEDRICLKKALQRTRQYNWKHQKTMELISLKHPSLTQELLQRYFKANKDQLNDSHKFMFISLLLRYELYEEAQYLLNSIDTFHLIDKNKMLKLNHDLSICLGMSDFEKMLSVLRNFAPEEVSLSPYLLQECIKIENRLSIKLRKGLSKEQVKSTFNNSSEKQLATRCLLEIRDLVAKIDMFLKRDEEEVPVLIERTIAALDQWKKHSANITVNTM